MSGFPPSSPAGDGDDRSGFPPSKMNRHGGAMHEERKGGRGSGFPPFPPQGQKEWKSNRVGGAHGTGKALFPHQQGKPVGETSGTHVSSPHEMGLEASHTPLEQEEVRRKGNTWTRLASRSVKYGGGNDNKHTTPHASQM